MRRGILLGVLVLAASLPSTAVFAGCTGELADCYQRAANIDDFWARWAAGLECEIDYIECLRQVLISS